MYGGGGGAAAHTPQKTVRIKPQRLIMFELLLIIIIQLSTFFYSRCAYLEHEYSTCWAKLLCSTTQKTEPAASKITESTLYSGNCAPTVIRYTKTRQDDLKNPPPPPM